VKSARYLSPCTGSPSNALRVCVSLCVCLPSVLPFLDLLEVKCELIRLVTLEVTFTHARTCTVTRADVRRRDQHTQRQSLADTAHTTRLLETLHAYSLKALKVQTSIIHFLNSSVSNATKIKL